MYMIAVVDDEKKHVDNILNFLARFFDDPLKSEADKSKGGDTPYRAVVFNDGKDLLENYEPKFDIIFLDVEMPDVNGMEAARKIRKCDEKTAIIFITRMANFAVQGYDVGALDFMVKPIDYYQFSIKLKKAIRYVDSFDDKLIKVELSGDVRYLKASEIRYLEIQNHSLIFHLYDEELRTWGSLKGIAEQLLDSGFAYCNRCYLVNLRFVMGIDKSDCLLEKDRLAISRYKRKEFMTALAKYYSR